MPAPASADPAERYRTALTCLDAGDEAGARRAVEEGLACSWQPCAAGTRECLDDLASQLDGEAALHRFAGRTPGPRGWLARPDDLARDVLALRRAHLVEAVIEEVALVLPPPVLLRLVGALGRAGTSAARDLLAACSAVLPGRAAHAARQHWGGCRPASPAVNALVHPRLAGAWRGPGGDQQQVIVAVARDGGRVAPLVALVDNAGAAPILRDAFFLPDMVPGRLEREVMGPLAHAGMAVSPMATGAALDLALRALAGARTAGRAIPSEAHQAVIARMLRLQAALAPSRGHDAPGSAADVG